jgi:hypothetical protein
MKRQKYAPDSFFTGIAGEAIIQSIFSKWKISTTKIGESDFGEDLLCDIFIASEDGKTNIRTNLTFRVQVKTTKEINKEGYIRRTKKGFSFSLETSLLDLWIDSYYPVLLVIWDLKKNCGYWCAPLQEYNSSTIPDTDTATIHFSKEMLLENSEKHIKEYVQEYYNGLLKLRSSTYQCYIYPLWMPKYRVFTFSEIFQFFREAGSSKVNHNIPISDYLPAFLASYNNINLDGGLPCIQFIDKADSLDSYITKFKKYLSDVSIKVGDNEWISFIISPIEIIQEDYRVINKMTDWLSFSLIENQLVTDKDYTFDVGYDYTYTDKVRASSNDQNLFIHSSGDFAIEILATGYNLASRRAYNLLQEKYYSRAICIWDVSGCSLLEIEQLQKWCYENEYMYYSLEDSTSVVVITHHHFSRGSYGATFPGASTWSEFDSFNLSSEEFQTKIPFGAPASLSDIRRVYNVYLNLPDKLSEERCVQYEQILEGEVLNHQERLVHFISYIHPINPTEFQAYLEEIKDEYLETLSLNSTLFDLFVDHYKDISDLVLNIRPKWNKQTKETIESGTLIFKQIIERIRPFCYQTGNMAYYIKYRLDRFLPEDLVQY